MVQCSPGPNSIVPRVVLLRRVDVDRLRRLINETAGDVVYSEVGDRTPGDEGSYPDDDLKARLVDGKLVFVHKDGSPY